MSLPSAALDGPARRTVPSVEQPTERDLNDFAYFAAVVRHRGFGTASRATGIPKSRLSRRLRDLEDRLGARLIQRSTSRFEVTEIGQMFFAHCEAALAEIEAAEAVTQFYIGEPRGLLRVSSPPGDCADAIGNMLPGFLADYPNVRVELLVSMRRVDLISEQVDVAVRARSRLDTEQDLIVKQLATLHAVLVASPELLDRLGEPESIEDLSRYPTIGSRVTSPGEWTLLDETGAVHRHPHSPVVLSDDLTTIANLCQRSLGIALLPEAVVRSAIDDGRMRQVLPRLRSDSTILHMAFPTRRGMLPSVRIFIDRASQALIEQFRERRAI